MNYIDGWDLVKEGLEVMKDDLFYYKPREYWKNLLIKLKLKEPPKPSKYDPVLANKYIEEFSEAIHKRALEKPHKMNPYVTVQDLQGEVSTYDG